MVPPCCVVPACSAVPSSGLFCAAVCRPQALTWIKEKYYHYNLWTGLYMLDPWEKKLFSTCRCVRVRLRRALVSAQHPC